MQVNVARKVERPDVTIREHPRIPLLGHQGVTVRVAAPWPVRIVGNPREQTESREPRESDGEPTLEQFPGNGIAEMQRPS